MYDYLWIALVFEKGIGRMISSFPSSSVFFVLLLFLMFSSSLESEFCSLMSHYRPSAIDFSPSLFLFLFLDENFSRLYHRCRCTFRLRLHLAFSPLFLFPFFPWHKGDIVIFVHRRKAHQSHSLSLTELLLLRQPIHIAVGQKIKSKRNDRNS